MAIYCRISKDSEGRSEGVAAQERRARALAAERWPDLPVRVFADNDITAADPSVERPGYVSMLAALRRGEIAHVVAAEQSRLTRQPAEWEQLAVTLSLAGIPEVHTYRNGQIQVGGSRLMGRILAAVDAEEVERLKARLADRLDALAAEGRPAGGVVYGYAHGVGDDGRKVLVPIPERAEVVRWAAEAVISGWSLTNIARTLRNKCVPTARSGRWTSTTVRAMLRAPTVAGFRVHRAEIVGKGNWPPILDEATWRQVNAILASPATVRTATGGTYRVSRERQPARRYLLTGGVARCGRCGQPLVAQQRRSRSGGSTPSYLCHPAKGGCSGIGIGAEGLEKHVIGALLDELDRPSFLAALAGADSGAERRADIVRDLGEVEARASDLARLWAVGDLSSAEWDAARSSLTGRRGQLSEELAALPAPVAALDPGAIRAGWDSMTLDERRALIRRFIDHLVVYPAAPGTRRFDPSRVKIAWRR